MIINLVKLFWSFLKVGSFSFGGAYSLLPIIENEIVSQHHWLTRDEFVKILGLVEIFPGAISIKFATYAGFKVAGIPGIIVANLGNLLMPAVLITIVFVFYSKFESNYYLKKIFDGIKFIIIGMIIAIMFRYFFNMSVGWKSIAMVAVGIVLTAVYKLNPIAVVVIGAVISVVLL